MHFPAVYTHASTSTGPSDSRFRLLIVVENVQYRQLCGPPASHGTLRADHVVNSHAQQSNGRKRGTARYVVGLDPMDAALSEPKGSS